MSNESNKRVKVVVLKFSEKAYLFFQSSRNVMAKRGIVISGEMITEQTPDEEIIRIALRHFQNSVQALEEGKDLRLSELLPDIAQYIK